MAEKLAFERVDKFCQDVREFYPPGVSFIIVSDGRVYNSQFEIPLEDVLSFQKELCALNQSRYMKIIGLEDFFPVTSAADKRNTLMDIFGQTLEKVDERIRTDVNFNRVYCGFKHFMMEELKFPKGATLKTRRRKSAGSAREMMRSNDAYGRLVECVFPTHIRLSIHAHNNIEKVGIQLVPVIPESDFQWGTPWHNSAVKRHSGEWQLLRKNIALQRGYVLNEAGPLPFFEE